MALTADRAGTFLTAHDNLEFPVPLGAVDCGFIGSLLAINPATGYGAPAGDTANYMFAGVIARTSDPDGSVDNSNGSAGDITAYVKRRGRIRLTVATGTLAVTDMFAMAYMVSDNTFDLAANATNDIPIGFIDEIISTTEAYVCFDVAAQRMAVVL